jgi:hypothetical protein
VVFKRVNDSRCTVLSAQWRFRDLDALLIIFYVLLAVGGDEGASACTREVSWWASIFTPSK